MATVKPLVGLALAAFLLANPALAEGQYELAKPSPSCLLIGMQNADSNWVDDPAEQSRILATHGQVARLRNLLRLNPTSPRYFDATFVDLSPPEDAECRAQEYEAYRFLGMAGRHALINVAAYEYGATFLVDLESGQRHEIPSNRFSLSVDGSFILFSEPSSAYADGPDMAVYGLQSGLKVAHLAGLKVGDSLAVWTGEHTALVKVYSTGNYNSHSDATLTITADGIEVRVKATGEILTAPFEPVSLQ